MSYATRQEIIDRYGSAALIVAADRDGDGLEDAGVVDKALVDAGELMDSYIGAKYQLPLATVPAVLKPVCVDLAFYRLCQGAAALTEEITRRHEQAVSWLRDLARGVVTLGEQPAPPSSGGGIAVSGPARTFTRKTLEGW
jgi:phage gp36-like protein